MATFVSILLIFGFIGLLSIPFFSNNKVGDVLSNLRYGDVIEDTRYNIYYLFIKRDRDVMFVKQIPKLIPNFTHGDGQYKNYETNVFIRNAFLNIESLTLSHHFTIDDVNELLHDMVENSDIVKLYLPVDAYKVIYNSAVRDKIVAHFNKLQSVSEYDSEMKRILLSDIEMTDTDEFKDIEASPKKVMGVVI